MQLNSSGYNNTALGHFALINNSNGWHNTAIGDNAGGTYGSNYYCTFLGSGANPSSNSLTNATAIGYNSIVTASNSIQLGNSSVTNVNTYGNVTVQNGKGLIRSNDGTQQKKVVTVVTVNTSIAALSTYGVAVSFSEAFSSAPDVFIGNITGGGGFAEVIMSVANVSATGCSFYVSNPRTSTYSPNYSVKIIAIGPQ
jgi:hypothetical protein